MSLGIVVGPGIGGFLADFGLKFPFLISALVSLVAVIFSIFVLKESETKQASQGMDMANNESMVRKIALSVKMPYFIPLIITLVMSFGLMAYESVIGLYLDNQFNSTPKDIATMVTATGIVSVIVQLFVVDRIVRRFGEVSVLIIFISVSDHRIPSFTFCFKLPNFLWNLSHHLPFYLHPSTSLKHTDF